MSESEHLSSDDSKSDKNSASVNAEEKGEKDEKESQSKAATGKSEENKSVPSASPRISITPKSKSSGRSTSKKGQKSPLRMATFGSQATVNKNASQASAQTV